MKIFWKNILMDNYCPCFTKNANALLFLFLSTPHTCIVNVYLKYFLRIHFHWYTETIFLFLLVRETSKWYSFKTQVVEIIRSWLADGSYFLGLYNLYKLWVFIYWFWKFMPYLIIVKIQRPGIPWKIFIFKVF